MDISQEGERKTEGNGNVDVVRLDVEGMPKSYYNIAADLPVPVPPPLNPATHEPISPEALGAIFPMALIQQEVSTEREIRIPDEVRETLIRLGRPTPLYRARRLEKALKTPAEIYFKREDMSFTGSHKVNTAIAQAYYNRQAGTEKLTTETGAGQWGSALALACSIFEIGCEVFMVRCSFEQKPDRRIIMQLYGAEVHPSPSEKTIAGRNVLKSSPGCPGSLGIAISEAIEVAATSGGKIKYSLGSVLNHVLLHQTVIGLELEQQLKVAGVTPDVMIGCAGGGSNFGGFALPFIGKKLRNDPALSETRFIAAESGAAPSLTRGKYDYDFGDEAEMTPLIKMHSLGHKFIPAPVHAGGLRYHGKAPLICLLKELGIVEAIAYDQQETFEAARIFTECEGIIPAPETAHAIKCAIDEALDAKRCGKKRTIVFNFSGHGLLDLKGYRDILKL
jgi:tryptophan synthase beta chain